MQLGILPNNYMKNTNDKYNAENHGDILQVVNHYNGEIVNLHDNKMTIAFNGTPEKLETILALIEPFDILDIVRSGIAVIKKYENDNLTKKS